MRHESRHFSRGTASEMFDEFYARYRQIANARATRVRRERVGLYTCMSLSGDPASLYDPYIIGPEEVTTDTSGEKSAVDPLCVK